MISESSRSLQGYFHIQISHLLGSALNQLGKIAEIWKPSFLKRALAGSFSRSTTAAIGVCLPIFV
jgi:hypothetical protein